MQSLNPFLRAFFSSKQSSQCQPSTHFVLLVPPTDFLFTARDRESGLSYLELLQTEDFVASHVIRIPGGLGPVANSRDVLSLRENKGKARQYYTLDGKTIVIKEAFAYSNKGFKRFNQAQLLSDEIIYTDAADTPQWLVYYISRPLVGLADPASIPTAPSIKALPAPPEGPKVPAFAAAVQQTNGTELRTLNDLLNRFPNIARHMQPDLERLFKEFTDDMKKGAPSSVSAGAQEVEDHGHPLERTSSRMSTLSRTSSHMSRTLTRTSTFLDAEENYMRGLAETLVMSACDIFQSVDKQQLSTLAAATNLAGPQIERMIERYVLEHVHDSVLFPKVCSVMSREDDELDSNIRAMKYIDITQLGIAEGDKQDHSKRVLAAIGAFRKMGVAGSPMGMTDVLLETARCLATHAPSTIAASHRASVSSGTSVPGVSAVAATNADTLVSLLMMVIIRSPIRHLHARLVYMRDFAFMDDVDSGEVGYALSTFEAVLSYLSTNSRGLRKVSKINRNLWQAVRQGQVATVRKVLEPDNEGDDSVADDDVSSSEMANVAGRVSFKDDEASSVNPLEVFTSPTGEPTLAHVFPWNGQDQLVNASKPKKRVSMAKRSLSNASNISMQSSRSRSSTIGSAVESVTSTVIGDTTPEQLSQIRDDLGHSLLMVAIEHNQKRVLDYLLQLDDLIKLHQVLSDCDDDQTTLLSAAVQAGRKAMVQTLLRYLARKTDMQELSLKDYEKYLARKDSKGRCVAHYLVSAPYLIPAIGHSLPWKLKDNNGQTPLFALCRSWDVESYFEVVDTAITSAAQCHGGDGVLRLDEHVDKKGNTLLHVVNEPRLVRRLLYQCDSDPNACNDKHFTPLMLASKFARTELVRTLYGDDRVDHQARDYRGLTAIELAKDDEVRNRIDDMALLLAMPASLDQKTIVVRSLFVEDGSIRLLIKSGARNANNTITVTTCRRSMLDFENLAQWLALEHPSSWVPSIFNARSPFQIPSKPSRQMLRDTQIRLDHFLQNLFGHSTFASHEMLWEFVLVPDINSDMLADRAHQKAQLRLEKLHEDYVPLTRADEVREFEIFVAHARQQVLSVHNAYRAVFRNVSAIRSILADIAEAQHLMSQEAMRTIGSFMPQPYTHALTRFSRTYGQMEWSPNTQWQYSLLSTFTTTTALLTIFARPNTLTRSLRSAQMEHARLSTTTSLSPFSSPSKSGGNAASRFLALLDDSTRANKREQESRDKIEQSKREVMHIGRELRYTQETIAGELAGWQESHAKAARASLRQLAKRTLVVERERLAGLRRVQRELMVNTGRVG